MKPDFTNIKAVIFDMDGVLFNSSGFHEQAFLEVLAPYNIEDFHYPRDGAGIRADETFRNVFSRNGRILTEDELISLVDAKRSRVRSLLSEGGLIADGSAELVSKLGARYLLAIATSGSRASVDIFLSKAGYGDAFEFILDGSSVERAKPDPEIYLLASEKLEVAPNECVVVEDGVSGIRAAVAAGMTVIGITSTDDESNLKDAGASYIVNHLSQVADLLIKE